MVCATRDHESRPGMSNRLRRSAPSVPRSDLRLPPSRYALRRTSRLVRRGTSAAPCRARHARRTRSGGHAADTKTPAARAARKGEILSRQQTIREWLRDFGHAGYAPHIRSSFVWDSKFCDPDERNIVRQLKSAAAVLVAFVQPSQREGFSCPSKEGFRVQMPCRRPTGLSGGMPHGEGRRPSCRAESLRDGRREAPDGKASGVRGRAKRTPRNFPKSVRIRIMG